MKNSRASVFADLLEIKSQQRDLAFRQRGKLIELREILINENPSDVEEGIEQATGVLATTDEIENVSAAIRDLEKDIATMSMATMALASEELSEMSDDNPLKGLFESFKDIFTTEGLLLEADFACGPDCGCEQEISSDKGEVIPLTKEDQNSSLEYIFKASYPDGNENVFVVVDDSQEQALNQLIEGEGDNIVFEFLTTIKKR